MNTQLTVGVFIFLILASYPLKLVHLNDPYHGPHLFRQLQTMSTIDAYIIHGIDFFHPRTNYAGWPGFLLYEFPIFQAVAAFISGFTHNALITTRALNLIFATASIALVYAICRFWFDRRVAAYSSLFFTWSPLNIMFHSSTLIDISCVFFALASQLVLLHWTAKRRWWLGVLFFSTGALCLLIKPLYFLPVIILFAIQLIIESLPPSPKNVWASVSRHGVILSSLLLMGVLLISWISIGKIINPSRDVYQLLGFTDLLKPKYYVNFYRRFMEYYVTPFNTLFFMVGIFLLWHRDRKTVRIQCLAAPLLYYLLFSKINSPHSYYSLIMIPYFSIITGIGARWFEEILQKEGIVKNISISRLFIVSTSIFTCSLMFLRGWTSWMILPQQRYAQMAQEVSAYLEPMNQAVVYVNRRGNFKTWEYLRNQPALYLKSFFKDIDYEEMRVMGADFPLIRSAVLYALKQYGGMYAVDSINEIHVDEVIKNYQGNLRYIIFYLFNNEKAVEEMMRPTGANLIYKSEDWRIYDLAAFT